MPTIQAIGTAFTAMKVAVNTKTKQQLEEEEGIGQSSDTSTLKPDKAFNIQDKTITQNQNEQTVVFADPTNGALVKLNLSNENIDKLRKHFTGENNFLERKDGSLRLNGEAEAFVSGWFGDIAYKREFLRADTDSDGELNDSEYRETRNQFNAHGELLGSGDNILSAIEQITSTYTKVSEHSGSKIVNYSYGKTRPNNISEELNITLAADADLNSNMTLSESYKTNESNKYKSSRATIIRHVKDAFPNDKQVQNAIQNTFGGHSDEIADGNYADKELELLLLQTKALQKLRASNGDENTLTAEEKKALGGELASLKKQFDKQEDLSSIKQELKEKIESTQFIDVRA